MKIAISKTLLIVTKEKTDKRVKNESQLMYKIKNILNEDYGYNLIKKEMAKDGHLMSDGQYYLRPKKLPKDNSKNVAIYDTHWQIRDSSKEFNKNGISFTIVNNFLS